jgi:AraC family transcriptional regulator
MNTSANSGDRPVASTASNAPVDVGQVRTQSVRVSSRPLGWGPLNIERREEPQPDGDFLPAGTTEHLIFVGLADHHITCESEGEIVEAEYVAGQMSIHPSRTPVRWEWGTKLHFLLMTLDPEFLNRVAREMLGESGAAIQLEAVDGKYDPVVSNVASALMREVIGGQAGSRMLAESLANVLAVHLIRNYAGRPAEAAKSNPVPARAVSQAARFIEEHFSSDLDLSDIAGAARMSTFHLTRVFKKAMGVSPHQYLVQVRVNSARALLTSGAGRRSLAEVAAAVGFSDQSHLTRHFKRVLGMTPKQARLS